MPTTPEVLHFVGYLTGATLYAMLLAMVARAGRRRGDRLAIATAALGLSWNVGELTAHGLTGLGLPLAADWMAAAACGALGCLAAVAVHSAVATPSGNAGSTRPSWTRGVLTMMYACAGIAAVCTRPPRPQACRCLHVPAWSCSRRVWPPWWCRCSSSRAGSGTAAARSG